MKRRYKVTRYKGKWWVIGHLERNIWMPIRGPHPTRAKAEEALELQLAANRAAIVELYGWDMQNPQSALE